jgi:chromosome segregation ATPase
VSGGVTYKREPEAAEPAPMYVASIKVQHGGVWGSIPCETKRKAAEDLAQALAARMGCMLTPKTELELSQERQQLQDEIRTLKAQVEDLHGVNERRYSQIQRQRTEIASVRERLTSEIQRQRTEIASLRERLTKIGDLTKG